jgi:hypothetical protein
MCSRLLLSNEGRLMLFSIGNGANVDQELGFWSGSGGAVQQTQQLQLQGMSTSYNSLGQQRLAAYGSYVAPLDLVLPPLQQPGRNDPIAMLGRRVETKANNKKKEKAQEDMMEGKAGKMNDLEKGLKWVSQSLLSRCSG